MIFSELRSNLLTCFTSKNRVNILKIYSLNKLFLFVFTFFAVISFQSHSQTSNKMSTKPGEIETLSPEKVEAIQKKINQIEGHLQAIETKRTYILSSPEQTAIAEESGWFESMTAIEDQLMVKKEELIHVLNNAEHD